MKSLAFLLLLVLPFTSLFADDSTSVNKVFIHKAGKNNLYVLQLKDGNAYDYMRYTNMRMYHDFGIYSVRHGKIIFESHNRKHGFNSVGGKTYFISKKGLFKTRMKSILGKDAALEFSDNTIYMNAWNFNPITGKSAVELEAEKVNKTKSTKTSEQRKAEAMAFTKTFYLKEADVYANPYKSMLETSYCGPGNYTTLINNAVIEWDYDTAQSTLVNDFGTVIHESTHTFNGSSILVIPGIAIPCTTATAFHSSEIKKIAPADASTKIFRYETYVGDSSGVSANISGINGLMDEFSAYENGTRADVLAAQSALEKGDTVLAKNFLSQAKGSYFACYEFNLFIGWYLHYGKIYHPDLYKETMANTNLRLVYTLINQEYVATLEDFLKTNEAAGEGKDFLTYSESEYAAYPKQLLVKEQPYLNAFMIKGANEKNYLSYEK